MKREMGKREGENREGDARTGLPRIQKEYKRIQCMFFVFFCILGKNTQEYTKNTQEYTKNTPRIQK